MLRSGRLLRSRPWQEFRVANTLHRLEVRPLRTTAADECWRVMLMGDAG